MLSILQMLQVLNDKQCLICQKPAPAEPEKCGKFYEISGKQVWLCMEDATSFFVGRAIGHSELNKTILDLMLSMKPEDAADTLRARIMEHVPDAARQLYERDKGKKVKNISPRILFASLSAHVVG